MTARLKIACRTVSALRIEGSPVPSRRICPTQPSTADGVMSRSAQPPKRGTMRLSSWWAYIAFADSTKAMYAHQLDKRIVPRFGGWALRDITPSAVEGWVGQMRRDGTGDPSILKALTVLQAIFKRAVIDDYVKRNPVALIRKPRQRRTRQ